MDKETNGAGLVRAERAMKVTKLIMWAVGIFNLLAAALLIFTVISSGRSATAAVVRGDFWRGLRAFVDGHLIYMLLYWIFVLPASSGFGLGTAIFFLRDQKRIGIFDRSCVAFIVLFALSLVPGAVFAGTMVISMF